MSEHDSPKRRNALLVAEQMVWSASNAVFALSAGLFTENGALAFAISAQAAISVAGGLLRALSLEGRATSGGLARPALNDVALLITVLLAILAVLVAVHDQSPALLLAAVFTSLCYLGAEFARAGAQVEQNFKRLLAGSALWFGAVVISAAIVGFTSVIEPVIGLVGAWGLGALLAGGAYGMPSSSTEARLKSRESAVEYALASGTEQLSFVVGGFVVTAVSLATVRLASVVLAPINVVAIALRTGRFVGAQGESKQSSLLAPLVALVVGLGVSLAISVDAEDLWRSVLAVLPVAIPARIAVARLFFGTVEKRQLVGVIRTGLMRALPSLGLVSGFLLGLAPVWCFALQAAFGLLALRLFQDRVKGLESASATAS